MSLLRGCEIKVAITYLFYTRAAAKGHSASAIYLISERRPFCILSNRRLPLDC